jgi:hypothetical protein
MLKLKNIRILFLIYYQFSRGQDGQDRKDGGGGGGGGEAETHPGNRD